MAQCWPAGTAFPTQVSEVMAKSDGAAPPMRSALTCRSAFPVLVTVTVLAAVAPPSARWDPKSVLAGVIAVIGLTPVPLRAIDWLPSPASSENTTPAGLLPLLVGANTTVAVQLAPPAIVPEQV